MNQEKLGKFLVTLRKEKGLKQKDIAERIGVTEQAVSKWERGLGLPDISLWDSICEAFDITLIELLNSELNEKSNETDEIVNNLIKDTIDRSNERISKLEIGIVIILIGLSISIYVVSLAINIPILNFLLFVLASIMVLYLLGIIFKKWNYSKKFLFIALIIISIILGYSYLEKVSIIKSYRRPIFSVKEIYKEYNVTIYKSLFYSAYSCDYSNDEITIVGDDKVESMCPNNNYSKEETTENITLKSGVTIAYDQIKVLDKFKNELLKFGYVDYNYMREEDLEKFWNYIDETHYCNSYNSNNSNLLVKRKDGVCQYDNDEFYYCAVTKNDGSIKYEKAVNRSCTQ